MPIKITAQKAQELQKEHRCLPNSDHNNEISSDQIYLPKELQSLMPLIQRVCELEMLYNPDFLSDNYIFLSVSSSQVLPNSIQRRGGWHIDGHQGVEKCDWLGRKLPCDRQYLISNSIPTQVIDMEFNFDRVREYCKKHGYLLDDVNMQDVLEYYGLQHEKKYPESVSSLQINQLYYLNPYMVHRGAVNNTDHRISRTFVRILCSRYARDRLGDTVNPVLGPVYPLKIKTIDDIHEIPINYM